MSKTADKFGTLGIDAGGTFTDLAFITGAESKVIAQAKTPTIHSDMPHTIENGLALILRRISPDLIKNVNISSTLATNAVVEGKLRPVGLILIGCDQSLAQKLLKENKLGAAKVAMIAGGHDCKGCETAPLDVIKLNRLLPEMLPFVESMAVSGFFSVRNPSHEFAAKEIILSLSRDMPVTCGHEVTSSLDALARATTAAVNSGLIPIMNDLINAVDEILKKHSINAPVSIVRGDGSLVSSGWAKNHPVETMLSGPAASAIGACHLTGANRLERRPAWVVDIGGTTADIIHVDENGRPKLTEAGTTVGKYHTLIKSIDICTFGLGGDSRIRFGKSGELIIGPGRVKPLSSSSAETHEIKSCLDRFAAKSSRIEPLIVSRGRSSLAENPFESGILEKLSGGSLTLWELIADERFVNSSISKIEEMESKGLLSFSGFTPTDALIALRRLELWDAAAAELGARILAGSSSVEDFCERVCQKVAADIALAVLKKSLSHTGKALTQNNEDSLLLSLWLNGGDETGNPSVKIAANAAIIGVGAPAWAFMQNAAALLGEDVILPENAEVAGAVGAAAAAFSLRYSVLINPLRDGSFRAHLPVGINDYETLEEAVEGSKELMNHWLTRRAFDTGASAPVIDCIREDEEIFTDRNSQKLYLSTELSFSVEERLTV